MPILPLSFQHRLYYQTSRLRLLYSIRLPRHLGRITSMMHFPPSELSAYQYRLSKGLPTFTTRTQTEYGKYFSGQITMSPFGLLVIQSVWSYNHIYNHPFWTELSLSQQNQIIAPYNVIKFTKYPTPQYERTICT